LGPQLSGHPPLPLAYLGEGPHGWGSIRDADALRVGAAGH